MSGSRALQLVRYLLSCVLDSFVLTKTPLPKWNVIHVQYYVVKGMTTSESITQHSPHLPTCFWFLWYTCVFFPSVFVFCLPIKVSITLSTFAAATQVFDSYLSFPAMNESASCAALGPKNGLEYLFCSNLFFCSICLHKEAPDTTCAEYLLLSPGLRVLFAGI